MKTDLRTWMRHVRKAHPSVKFTMADYAPPGMPGKVVVAIALAGRQITFRSNWSCHHGKTFRYTDELGGRNSMAEFEELWNYYDGDPQARP